MKKVAASFALSIGFFAIFAMPVLAELPKPRPDFLQAAESTRTSHPSPTQDIITGSVPKGSLRDALSLAEKGNLTAAQRSVNPQDRALSSLLSWLYVREHGDSLEKDAFARAHPHWPQAERMMKDAESALLDSPDERQIFAFFQNRQPKTTEGRIALAYAFHKTGRKEEARNLLRPLWHSEDLSDKEQTFVLTHIQGVLTQKDHSARFHHFLFSNGKASTFAASRLGKAEQSFAALTREVLAAKTPNSSHLSKIPNQYQNHPATSFLKARIARKADKPQEATRHLLNAIERTTDSLQHTTLWTEQKILIRDLLDIGKPEEAYALAKNHRGQSPADQIEGYFHAGWIALRFLNRPQEALPFFQRLSQLATQPISIARGAYWQGRTLDVLGRKGEAEQAYKVAARWGTTFYGQMAKARLGDTTLALRGGAPSDKQGFERLDLVRAFTLSQQAGRDDLAATFARGLANTLENPNHLALLGQMTERLNNPKLSLTIGKAGLARGFAMDTIAYPLRGLPDFKRIGTPVEKAVVYGIARQESEFSPDVRSHAGATGMMQLMPATAKRTAQAHGVAYSPKRLTDAAYNTMLGSAHLGELSEKYTGSYILMFAAYNAGGGNVNKWIERMGDPRDPRVDPIDWIERIPFSETRNYVQRVLENVQVYRARLNNNRAPLTLHADLMRGRGERVGLQ